MQAAAILPIECVIEQVVFSALGLHALPVVDKAFISRVWCRDEKSNCPFSD
jgi:hypothetical protein